MHDGGCALEDTVLLFRGETQNIEGFLWSNNKTHWIIYDVLVTRIFTSSLKLFWLKELVPLDVVNIKSKIID